VKVWLHRWSSVLGKLIGELVNRFYQESSKR
jgi:hypothetical protein